MSTDSSNNHLSEFLSFETKQHQSSSSDDTTIGRHALDQLLESKLGNEIKRCAQQLATNNKHNNDNSGDISSSILEEEVTKLMNTPAFQQVNAQIQECPLSLLLPSKRHQSIIIGARMIDPTKNQEKNRQLQRTTTSQQQQQQRPFHYSI